MSIFYFRVSEMRLCHVIIFPCASCTAKVLHHRSLFYLSGSQKTNLASHWKMRKNLQSLQWRGVRLCFFDEFSKISNYHSHKTFTENHMRLNLKRVSRLLRASSVSVAVGHKLMKQNFFQLNINFIFVFVFFKTVFHPPPPSHMSSFWRDEHVCHIISANIKWSGRKTHSLPLPPPSPSASIPLSPAASRALCKNNQPHSPRHLE